MSHAQAALDAACQPLRDAFTMGDHEGIQKYGARFLNAFSPDDQLGATKALLAFIANCAAHLSQRVNKINDRLEAIERTMR